MKIKHIIATCFFTILLFSCSEDFLTIPSASSLSVPVYFKTQADFESAVNGIYNPLSGFFNYTTPNFAINGTANHLLIGDMHSDNARYYYNPSYRATIAQENVADFVPDIQNFSGFWNTFYGWIARANQVLSCIDDATFDQAVKDNLKGQALFLRAYSYWWLARVYGDACIHLVPVTSVEGASKPLSPVADVLAQVIDDATLAVTLLKNKATQTPGRVTSGTARMLLADVYIWQKQWALAETQLTGLSSEYSLMPNYSDITDPAKKNNAESIFEIQFSSASTDFSHCVAYTMIPIPFRADSIKVLTGVSNPQAMTAGEGMCIPTPELLSKYEAGDKRKAATIKMVHDASGVSAPMCVKYLHTHSLYQQTGDNMPVYRYAEALLFLAEAVNEQGRLSEALGYLNQVRTRAGLANSTAATQADIRDAIMKERQVEFAFEGKRWFDLVRTDNVQAVIGAYGANVKANPMSYYFSPGITPVPLSFTSITTTFSIPDAERLYNPYID
jgi:hypothetical protein